MFSQHADRLIEKGYPVIPVDGKRPVIKDWSTYCESLPSADDIHIWSASFGDKNIGLPLGPESGLVGLDVDTDDKRVHKIIIDVLGESPVIRRGKKGYCAFYKYSGQPAKKLIGVIELLSLGNQVVVPPSIHPDTLEPYTWTSLFDLESYDDDFPDLPMSSWGVIVDRIKSECPDLVGSKSAVKGEDVGGLEPGRCRHGSHNVISALGVALIHDNYPFDKLAERLLDKDREYNAGADKFYFTCATRKWKSNNGYDNAETFVDEIYRNHGPDGKYEEKVRTPPSNDDFLEDIAKGFTETIQPEGGKGKPKKVRNHVRLYQYFNHLYSGSFLPENKRFALWNGTHFEFKHKDFAKAFAQKHFNYPYCTAINDKSTFQDYCQNVEHSSIDEYLLQDKGVVNLRNGIYVLDDRALGPHNKAYKLSHVVPVDYDKDAVAPTWEELLGLICLGKAHLVQAIEEFIGYVLSGAAYTTFNHLLVLDGKGSNGKSTLLRVINALVGAENCGSMDLMNIGKERFASNGLVGKLLNVCAEVPKEAFSVTGKIKQLTGGDPISVEEKGAGFYDYVNIAKFIVSYNKMPFFPDDSAGMKRRMIIIPCEQDFDKHRDRRLEKPEQRIIESELSGVFNRCISAYHLACERGQFIELQESKDRVEELILASSPVRQFVKEEIDASSDGGGWLHSKELFDRFLDFQGGKTRYGELSFMKKLKEELADHLHVESIRQHATWREVKKKYRGLSGIAWKSEGGNDD